MGLVFLGEAALEEAGLACAGGAIDQDHVGPDQHVIQGVDFFFSTEKDIYVFACIGVEKL
jgi:hypothetical protein